MKRVAGIAVALGCVTVVVVVRSCTRTHGAVRVQASSTHRLDVAAFRAELGRRLARARELVARPLPVEPVAESEPRRRQEEGTGAIPSLCTSLLGPPCSVGPPEVCAAIAKLVVACDGGDAASCLAAGQYAEDTPPRSRTAVFFYVQACRIGDDDACARLDTLHGESAAGSARCDADLLACSFRASRLGDGALADQACALGAGDSCLDRVRAADGDDELKRGYIEAACQLGETGACAALAWRLRADCGDSEMDDTCYPPDPEQARAALEIACSEGWTYACNAP
jgi:TPR repeat protein